MAPELVNTSSATAAECINVLLALERWGVFIGFIGYRTRGDPFLVIPDCLEPGALGDVGEQRSRAFSPLVDYSYLN